VIEYKNPLVFFTDDRLDLTLKYIFLKTIKEKKEDPEIKNLYKKHIIKRTGGIEPPDFFSKNETPKKNIQDYFKCCEELIYSFSKKSFDENFPIYFCDKGILSGSHRSACSILFNVDAACVKVNFDSEFKKWNRDWFLKNSFSEKEISFLENAQKQLILKGETLV
jgi:hypothetical protein